MSTKETVRVIIRCRPISRREKDSGCKKIVSISSEAGTVSLINPSQAGDERTFTFDNAFDESTSQSHVYNITARPIVDAVLDGFNGTIFAYGQTGTGKSFSMTGLRDPPELRGIIPNAIDHIFSHISRNAEKKFLVSVSFLEIYNEEIRDLIGSDGPTSPRGLDIKEHPEKGVYVKDLSTRVVMNSQEMEELMDCGNKQRSVGATLMNAESSRSHSIFSISIESCDRNSEARIVVGKLHLVDLAGSERQSKTGASGNRLKEAAKINLSLTALGNCISALVDGKSSHIPYRDSKLTRLLQDSLGGNSKTLMIATMSPVDYNFDESVSTLRYANRAKQIKNKPKINEDPKDAVLREYQDEIKRLQQQLEELNLKKTSDDTDPHSRQTRDSDSSDRLNGATSKPNSAPNQTLESMHEKIQQERDLILASKNGVDAERVKILAEMEERETELIRERQERLDLAEKLCKMEERLLVGGVNMIDKAESDAIELQRKELALEEQKRKKRQLEMDLAEQDELHLQIEESYSTLQEAVSSKTKKLKKVWALLMSHKSEIQDLQRENQREREHLLSTVRALAHDLKLKSFMVDCIVPQEYQSILEHESTWDDNVEAWQLPFLNELSASTTTHASTFSPQDKESGTDVYSSRTLLYPDLFISYEDLIPGLKINWRAKKSAPSTAGGTLRGRPASTMKRQDRKSAKPPRPTSKTSHTTPVARGLVA